MRKNTSGGTISADVDLFDIVKGKLLDEGLTEEESLDVMSTLTLEEINEVIQLDENQQLHQVRFSPRLDVVPILEKSELELYYKARKKLSAMYNSDKYRIEFKLQPKDLLMMDNYRLLHGRTEFDANEGSRFLQGCYLDFDSTEGKLRHLKRKFNFWQLKIP